MMNIWVDTKLRGSCKGCTSWAETQEVPDYIPGHAVSIRCSMNLCHGSGSAGPNARMEGVQTRLQQRSGGVGSVGLKAKLLSYSVGKDTYHHCLCN